MTDQHLYQQSPVPAECELIGKDCSSLVVWTDFNIPDMEPRVKRRRLALKPSPLLTKMATELLVQVFEYLGPADRLMLAVSCKGLLNVSTLVKIQTPKLICPITLWHARCCASLRNVLFFMPPKTEGPMAPCFSCFQFGRRTEWHWDLLMANRYPAARHLVTKDEVSKMLTAWADQKDEQVGECPMCWMARRCKKARRLGTSATLVMPVG